MVLGALQIHATMEGHVPRMAVVSRVIVLLSGQGQSALKVSKIIFF